MDMDLLMKQAHEMQERVTAAQESLSKMTIKGISGNGMVIVDLDGKYNLKKLTISDKLLTESAADIAAIISAAYMDAKTKVDTTIDDVMGEATGGMQLPA